MVGVEQWAEIRRLYFVEKRSKRAGQHSCWGWHRDTVTRALVGGGAAEVCARRRRGRRLIRSGSGSVSSGGGPDDSAIAVAGDGCRAGVCGRQVDL